MQPPNMEIEDTEKINKRLRTEIENIEKEIKDLEKLYFTYKEEYPILESERDFLIIWSNKEF